MVRAWPTVPPACVPEDANPSNTAKSLMVVVALDGVMAPPVRVMVRPVIWFEA